MDIFDLKKTILTNSSEREGARLLDSLTKSIILSSKGEDGVKLKEKYFDMCRKQALKILEEEGTTGAKALIEIEKLEIEISKAKIEVLEEKLKEKEETQQKDTNNDTENSESDNKEIKKEKCVKIGNLMIGEKGSGKTAELLKMSAKNKVYILTSNLQRVSSLANLADNMKLDIPFPISLPEAINGKLKGSYIEELYIDDVEGVLYELLGVKIKAMTITTKETK